MSVTVSSEARLLEERYECRAVGCRSRFCPHCCQSQGISLRERLIPVLATFSSLLMFTLTIDPKLFNSPEEAFEYIKKKRCVAELIKALKKAGALKSGRYVYVIEWQRHTEMPHFHVLVEAPFVDFKLLANLWGRHRPAACGEPEGNAPRFGHVRISKPKFASPEHAARYATKYLIKHPEHGYPDWVMNYKGRIRRFSSSRGLLAKQDPEPCCSCDDPPGPQVHEVEGPHEEVCFCEACRGEVLEEPQPSSVADRVGRCATACVVVKVREWLQPDGELVETHEFVEVIGAGWDWVRDSFAVTDPKARRFILRMGELGELRALDRGDP